MHALHSQSSIIDANPSRRSFLKLSVGAGAGLIIGASLPTPLANAASEAQVNPGFVPFVKITPDNVVTVVIKHLDKGQGTANGLATLVADELDARWDQLATEFAPADAKLYKNLFFGVQGTGGSTAIPNSFAQYRLAGATARSMLVQAAARKWGVPASEITVAGGVVRHSGGKTAEFGAFAEAAAALAVPKDVALKSPDQWVHIGKDRPRIDVRIKTEGAPGVYGMDVQMDNMLVAVLSQAPKFGGTLKSFDAEAARKVKGVVDVVPIPQGVAVLAKTTWPAIKARDLLRIEWDFSGAETRSSGEILADYEGLLDKPGLKARQEGDTEAALTRAAHVVEATYRFPYLAHAPMEPEDVTVLYDGKTAEFWTGSQLQTVDQGVAAQVLGLAPEKVKIHTMWAGGSFGRRAIYNGHYVAEAAALAKAWGKPQPIKVVYSREDDIRGGYYRPAFVHRVRAGVGADGKISGWRHQVVGQSIMTGTAFEKAAVHNGIDDVSVEGIRDATYAIPDIDLDVHNAEAKVPVLWWRSVGHTHTAYVMETMIDQLAKAAGKDPVAMRRALLQGDTRKLGVLDEAVRMSDWAGGPAAGRYRGVAVHKSFNTYVAQVAEISMREDGTVKVEKVWCAVDCGIAVNPDNIKAQMEGGIGFGLGAVLRNEITLTDGQVDQGNFDSYEPLRMEDMPEVEVSIIASTEAPTGVGEPGTPPIGPVVANAIFQATGKMPTDLPLSKQGLV
ncbi:MAG: molybdopterin cofactor-binding domain-containing protein [Hyphomicrobiales bacterium]